jgi:hypothetical protein
VDLSHGRINGKGLLADVDLLLVRAMAELPLDFNVTAARKSRGKLSELAPNYDPVPVSPAVVRAGIVFQLF